ncbi:MAG TPA: protein translocase subunit SecD, partial [Bacteroidia bacterium]|nr:protein translocase subunit SecD [Bacteroidia bacterium]
MRNKNTIIALLVIFTGICFFNLFMTYRAFSMESELNALTPEQADAKRREEGFKESYEYAQRNAFSLGLDLQGGLFVTLEVGVEDILREYAGATGTADPDFELALKAAIDEKVKSQEDLVELFHKNLIAVYDKANRPKPVMQGSGESILLARYFASQARGINANDADEKVKAKLKEDTEAAIENTYTIIRSRIDQFGVSSPNLSLQSGTGRILLELPGVKDPTRIKKLLRNSAKLEFRETVAYSEALPTLNEIDRVVKRTLDTEAGIAPAPVTPDTTQKDSAAVADGDSSKTAADSANTGISDLFNGKNDSATAVTDSSDTTNATADASKDIEKFKKDHPFLGIFDLTAPFAVADKPLIGIVSLSDTSTVNKWLSLPEVKAIIPFDQKFLWEAKVDPDRGPEYKNKLGLIAIRTNAEDKAKLEGNVVVDARQDYEPNSTNAMVSMNMNAEGGTIWQKITQDNLGKCVAIVLDNYVQTYPTIQSVISGGRSQITGNFSVDEAKDLANLLKAGALPVKAKILGDSQVGPSLGAENLNKGLMSFVVAFFAVIAFMGFYYRGAGMVANIALLINLLYIFGVSAALGIVFTLPGLAAVVLTMGMAVDANVLVFERIREEMTSGKGYKAAVQAGFKNAFSTVMDSNITTFITGLILFWFGIGPIAGFAVNLMIGIVTSLICSLFITRIILEWFGDRNANGVRFGTDFTIRIFNHVKIKMTERKKYFYIFSGALTALSLLSVAVFGFRTGVEFDGGRQVKIEFANTVSTESIRGPLTVAFDNKVPLIREVSGTNSMLITTSYKSEDPEGSEEVNKEILRVVNEAAPGSDPKIVESIVVGAAVASDIQRSAIFSVGFSLLAIFLYILFRFRRYQYSLGALAALVHDVAVVMGFFSFFGHFDGILPFSLEIDQAFIAAILTVIGFSINDTVIVFDRIRENLAEMKSSPLGVIYNESIDRTFSRTIITSGTVLLT